MMASTFRREAMRQRATRFRNLVAVACLAGCAQAAPSPLITQRDSSDILIVEHAVGAAATAERWTVDDEPSVEIGSDADGQASVLFQVRSVDWFSTGEVLVANGGTQEIRIFDATGKHVRTIGRKGSGPGEFEGLGWVDVAAEDSIVAYDLQLQRVTVFSSEGVVARSFPIRIPGVRFPFALRRLVDGSTLVQEEPVRGSGSASAVHRDTLTLHRVSSTGDVVEPLGRFPGGEVFLQVSGSNTRMASLAFGKTLELGYGDSAVFIGTTDRYEIRKLTPGGELVGIIRIVEVQAGPVTAEMVTEYKRQHSARIAEPEWQAFFREMDEAMPYPATLPLHSSLQVDSDQNLWVRSYPVHPDSGSDWYVFGPDGRLKAVAHLPARLVVHQIGLNRLLGVWRDPDEVEHVRIHAFRRGTP